MASIPFIANGDGLTPDLVAEVARGGRRVEIDVELLGEMEEAHGIVLEMMEKGAPVYGVTTGLGAKVKTGVTAEETTAFSKATIRGRATASGPPAPRDVVRAAMFARLNGLLHGGAGARPELAMMLADLLNTDLVPYVPSKGSIGAADLCTMAHIGLAMIGDGAFLDTDGKQLPAADALEAKGLKAFEPGPRDGLAICSSSAMSAGLAALDLSDSAQMLRAANLAAAMSMEAFRANLSPLDPRAAVARPQPGQMSVAWAISDLLHDSALNNPAAARRLQDPISFRCVSQVHGAFYAAHESARAALDVELNTAADSPLVLVDDREVISTGNFLTPMLTIALEGLAQAAMHVATAVLGRCGKLLANRFSDLPDQLASTPSGAGFAPLMKTAEAHAATIVQNAQAVAVMPSLCADGVEDVPTHTYLCAEKLAQSLASLRHLIAIELIVAAQAVDLRKPEWVAPRVSHAHEAVRSYSPALEQDRSMGADIDAVAADLADRSSKIVTAAYHA